MNLNEVILNCDKYIDSDEKIHMVFAKQSKNRFEPFSAAIVLELTVEEMEMDLVSIANSKCPGHDYFLEMFIIQDLMEDIKHLDEYKSNEEKVKRVIYYAEFDA